MSTSTNTSAGPVDVIIVGTGFAGLAAAQVLGRAQRRVVLIGSGPTRNAEAGHAHNVLTRDGTPPAELLALAHAEIDRLATVEVLDGWVERIEPGEDDAFTVHIAGREPLRAPSVLLATGARDVLPEVRGLLQLWGERAHSCPFCDAEAYAGGTVLLLAEDDHAAHVGALLRTWGITPVAWAPTQAAGLEADGSGVRATSVEGETISVDGVFVATTPVPRNSAVAEVALARRGPYVAVDHQQRTSQAGLWAAGDCAWRDDEPMPGGQIVFAMASGARAATDIILARAGITVPAPPPASEPATARAADEHEHFHVPADVTPEGFWEGFYDQRDEVWSGKVNGLLIEAVADLTPGRAVDLGCGEGADVMWLAGLGWQVTGMDISATALDRARKVAAEKGLAERTTFLRADLTSQGTIPVADLVLAAFLHSPVEMPREQILQRAAAAVAPGGHLVVLSHLGVPHWAGPGGEPLPTIEEQIAQVQGAEAEDWSVVTAEDRSARMRGHDGTVMQRSDALIVLRRAS